MSETNPNEPLVVVFHAGDPALLPIAEAALEQEGIAYVIQARNFGATAGFGHRPEFGGAEAPADILVSAGDADRASAVLNDLALSPEAPFELAPLAPGQLAVPTAAVPAGPRAYRLTELDSGAIVGDVTEEQLQFLADELEEESDGDRDYYMDASTIEMLEEAGADAELLDMLRRAVGSRDGVEIGWTKL